MKAIRFYNILWFDKERMDPTRVSVDTALEILRLKNQGVKDVMIRGAMHALSGIAHMNPVWIEGVRVQQYIAEKRAISEEELDKKIAQLTSGNGAQPLQLLAPDEL